MNMYYILVENEKGKKEWFTSSDPSIHRASEGKTIFIGNKEWKVIKILTEGVR
jgi:hypothetical protein